MAYIGQPPFQEFTNPPTKDSFTGDGSTTVFDLNSEVPGGSQNALEVYVDNVRQEPGSGKAFTLGVDGSGDTKRITFSAAPANGASIYVINDKTNASLVAPLQNDLNGTELILDGDADTSITADTDDRIDFKIANTDHIQLGTSSGDTTIKIATDAKDLQFLQADGRNILEINDAGYVALGNGATGSGQLRIYEDTDNGTNYSAFQVGTQSADITYTLPTADGTSGFQLTTNGSGVLSWAAAQIALANDGNNRIVTGTGSAGLNAEAGLTYDGSTLAVTGATTISTNLDVDGTTNLDAVDIDGAVQIDATLSVGVDDTGYDVKLFGDTASAFMLWDASADDLILSGAAGLIVPDGQFTLGSTAITSTGAEINILDGGNAASSVTLVDADRIILNDNGTMKQVAVSDLNTYTSSTIAADDVSIGDAAILLTTSSGNITIDAAANDSDIIIKGTDGGADTTYLTIDGSAAGAATFNDKIIATELDISGNVDVDGTLEADAITVDGTTLAEFISDTTGAMFSSNTETGITVTYQDGDNTIDLALAAAQTTITSLLATDIKIGEDDQTKIDFETADEIHFYAANVEQVYLGDNIFGPQTDSDVDLGTTGVRWKDAFIDSITTTGNITIGGDLTVSGDDITMGTNTAGNLLVADGTNFNSIAVSSLSEIGTAASDDVFIAIDTSGGGLKKITRSSIIAGTGSSGDLANVVEDTSPQLGGNLDMNGADIVTTSNATIDLAPNGTGTVVVRGNTNSGAIVFNCESNSHGQKVIAQPHSASVTNTMLLPAGANSTLVSLVSTDTLTNKTLTSPKVNEDVAVTSTATELNILDGVTSTTAELNILDGVTSTAAELNILDGVTSTATELNILDGVTATTAEINLIDGGTSATSTTIVDADRVILNDAGTMKQVAVTDIKTYTNADLDDPTALAIALG